MTFSSFGTWVRTRRKQLDLTQSGLGKRAGCSEAAIRKIEADERKPSSQLAELLSSALQIPQEERELFLQFARGMLTQEISVSVKTKSNPNNLPVLLTSTINRINDLAAVSSLITDSAIHLVTIIGPPGIGKTRLGIHCGNQALDQFADGVWFVDLAELTNAEFFIPSIARFIPTLGLPPSPSLSQLLSRLKDKSLLLILDNFEQIVEGASLDVAQILKACPKVKILVTSRVPLHIYGENEYQLPPLSVPPREAKETQDTLMQFESVQLFVARTRQHQPHFMITPENASAIIEICAILEGIPLALELAAATLRHMPLDEMAKLLRGKDWVKKIATSARDLPHRQRTLENVIDWSYTLLADEQKDFFCKLGVFTGWFDSNAVSDICETTPSKSGELLNVLTDHSLLMREIFNGKSYFRMLRLIHEYSRSKLKPEQRSRMELLHAEFFLKRLQTIRQQEPVEINRQTSYRMSIGNFHAALQWAIADKRTELAFQLVAALEEAWWSLGYLKEGLGLVRQLMTLPDESEPQVRANRLQMASDLAWQQHDFETGLGYSKAAVELGRLHGLKNTYPWHLNRLGRIYIEQERYAESRAMLEECLSLAYEDPGIVNPGSPLAQLGEIALFENRLNDAKSLLEKSLDYLKDGEEIFLAMAKTDLAEVALAQKDFPNALHWLRQAHVHAGGHIRRLLVFLFALAGYVAVSKDTLDSQLNAVRMYGALETIGAQFGIAFNSFYQNLKQERIQILQEKISKQEWLKAFESGRGWEKEEVLEQARRELGL
ncbi:MAG: helix-turn-helix domain-containing protein [Chloroflexi bacterium]|nr:helix-turn-helix domain-containing protein [Chloroflexota bacterium]